MSSKGASRRMLFLFVALVFVFLMLPMLIVFPLSFSSAPYLQFPPPGWSLQWYERYFGDPVWIEATVRSVQAGAATAVLSLAVGGPLAFSLVRGTFPGRRTIEQLTMAPMIIPTIVTSVAIYGLFSRLQLIGSLPGLIVAHTVLALPFVFVVMSAGFRGLDRTLEQAAAGLGAGRWVILWRVILPQVRPSIVSAGLLAFITSFDELVVAMFVAGTRVTLPLKMFDNIRVEVDPTIAAVCSMQIILVIVALALTTRFGNLRARSEGPDRTR